MLENLKLQRKIMKNAKKNATETLSTVAAAVLTICKVAGMKPDDFDKFMDFQKQIYRRDWKETIGELIE